MKPSIASALRITGVYVVLAALWIFLSDRVLARIVDDPQVVQELQTVKGWLFVAVTGVVLYLFARVQFMSRDRLLADLTAERERLSVLIEGVTDYAICMLDPDGNVVTWNAGAEHLTGWTAGEILGRHFSCFYPPADVAAGRPAVVLAEARRAGRFATEALRRRKDGSHYWASVRLTALRRADGTLRGFAKVLRDMSEQKRAESALAESERLFRAIFEQAAVGIAQAAPDGRLQRVNQRFCELVGRTADDLRRLDLAAITHPDDRDNESRLLARCLAGEIDHFRLEKRYLRTDGRIVWGHLAMALVHGPAGEPAYFVSVVQDISPRKAAEAALNAGVEQYRLLFAANPLPMLVYDLETLQILAVNESAISSYGYSREEFLAKTICDIRPPEDIPRLLEAVALVRAGRMRTPVERAGLWRHLRHDGSIIHVEISSHVVDFEGRRAELVLALDITARLRAEAALEESRARLSGIIDSAMDAIVTTDGRQRVILFNRAAEATFGIPAGDMLGKPIDLLLPARHREEHHRHIRRFAEAGVTSRRMGALGGIAGRRADGEEFPAEASISNVVTPSGSYFTVILRDITERKKAEDALADNRRRLQIAIESAHLGFWDWDIGANRIFLSPEWRKQIGCENEELSDSLDEFDRRIHPDDRARFEHVRASVLGGAHDTTEIEFRLAHKDGSYRDIRASMVTMRDAAGRPLRVIGTNLDLTPIRDAERTVRRLSAHILRLQDVERRRIARELHDTTAQNLAALNMNLARLGRALANEGSELIPLVDDTTALADLCVQEVRTLSYLLHPPLLDEFGLARAVEDYVSGYAARSGIDVSLVIDPPIARLPDEVELSLFRVLQESLGNVHKHSGSPTATVRLSQNEYETVLSVADAGRGIPAEQLERLRTRAALGVGVTGMNERIEQLNGRLLIDSGPQGTTVRAIVPYGAGVPPQA